MMSKRTNAEICREQYAKHRDKRLSAKKAEYWSDPEAAKAKGRASYAANREARVAYARAYRERNKAAILAKKAEEWRERKDEIKERRKAHKVDLDNRRRYAREYLKRHPDKKLLGDAKRLLSEAVGIAIRDIPAEIAEAKAEQLKIIRWVRLQIEAAKQAECPDSTSPPPNAPGSTA